jgi:hypothetical protein
VAQRKPDRERPPDIEAGAVVQAKKLRSKKDGEVTEDQPYRGSWHKGEWVEVRVDPALEDALSEEESERGSETP